MTSGILMLPHKRRENIRNDFYQGVSLAAGGGGDGEKKSTQLCNVIHVATTKMMG